VLTPFAKKVQRTCKNCGYQWIMPRGGATYRPRRQLFTRPPAAGYVNPNSSTTPQPGDDLSFAEELDLQDKLRRCPRCGAEHYSQRSVTKRHPASPGASDNTTET
jgi:ribosomal protein S27AE